MVLSSLQASNTGVTTSISNAKANSYFSPLHIHNDEKSLHELEQIFSPVIQKSHIPFI